MATMGRPLEYNQEAMHQNLLDYLATCGEKFVIKTKPEVERVKIIEEGEIEGEKIERWKNEIVENQYVDKETIVPSIEGFSLFSGVAKSTLYEWEGKYSDFSNDMEWLRSEQAKVLITNGLNNTFNSTIAKVLLSKHGYREGIEQTGKDGNDLIPKNGSDEAKALIMATVGKQPKKYVK